jgi:hypothetical protein
MNLAFNGENLVFVVLETLANSHMSEEGGPVTVEVVVRVEMEIVGAALVYLLALSSATPATVGLEIRANSHMIMAEVIQEKDLEVDLLQD